MPSLFGIAQVEKRCMTSPQMLFIDRNSKRWFSFMYEFFPSLFRFRSSISWKFNSNTQKTLLKIWMSEDRHLVANEMEVASAVG